MKEPIRFLPTVFYCKIVDSSAKGIHKNKNIIIYEAAKYFHIFTD